jgi:hypothetical protein
VFIDFRRTSLLFDEKIRPSDRRVRMKRIRQVVIAMVGIFYACLLYPLCTELWHSKWLLVMHDNECEPMFITFLVALGVFLLLAVRKPIEYRLVIAFAAWQRIRGSSGIQAMTFATTTVIWSHCLSRPKLTTSAAIVSVRSWAESARFCDIASMRRASPNSSSESFIASVTPTV